MLISSFDLVNLRLFKYSEAGVVTDCCGCIIRPGVLERKHATAFTNLTSAPTGKEGGFRILADSVTGSTQIYTEVEFWLVFFLFLISWERRYSVTSYGICKTNWLFVWWQPLVSTLVVLYSITIFNGNVPFLETLYCNLRACIINILSFTITLSRAPKSHVFVGELVWNSINIQKVVYHHLKKNI